MPDRKLNWRQACTLMGCGKTKFYEYVRLGRLPAYRAGKRGLWVKEEDVRRLVERVDSDESPAERACFLDNGSLKS